MENIDRLGSTSTNSAVEDGLGSTSTGSTSINDGSIMNDLRNPGGYLFYTDSNSDSEPESNNTAVEVSYLPDCPSQLKPYIGQIFLRLDDATEFYNKYARHVGFDTRKHGSKKKGDHVTWLYVVCSREGQRKMKMQGHESKRRRSSRKCFCKAKIAFKFCKGIGYVVNQFDEIHNHDMVELRHKRFMRLNCNIDLLHQKIILDCASANIGPTLTFKLLNEVLGGLDYVGCTVVEVRNYRRDLRAYTSGADAQMCDPIAKKNFHLYGDIVSFDTTYSTNRYCMIFAPFTGKDNHGRPVAFGAGLLSKENADSFTWLFERFVKCMGSAPKLIITDQDLGMKVAVERVLVDTRHRWCMWHIMFKVVEKLPKNLLGNEDLKKELNNSVWSELIEPEEFDEEWNKVMEKYGLKDNEWFSSMFASRKFWVCACILRDFPMSSPIKTTSISESQNIFFKRYSKSRSNLVEFLMNYNNALDGQRSNNNRLEYLDFNTIPTLKTNSALEKHASTIYSDSGFKLIQSEIEEAVDNVTMVRVSNIGENEIYVVNDKFSKNWTVSYSTSFDSYACSCKMFGRIGLVCSHIFWVLRNKKMKLIPNELHGGRWLKSKFVKAVHCGFDDDIETFIVVDETKQEYRDKIRAFRQIMAEGRKEVLGEGNVLSISEKRLMIENFYGSHVPSQIDVHPPDVVKTKGCGRRLSRLEKEMREMSKPGRKCGKCGEVGRHDSRNCDKIQDENNKKKRRNQC
ncbi:protein FAR1-RELATED SEQUENCE 5-like [Salvia splendens]|uniref:protein FAR1-RELATED SEQUENCE 5-like n=1 Tax=Salvia splendens TaxID=180675 RepID=UPI001C25BFC2|nr:protein FAR1-RELATED SEQUENCE 5-like [Salvia splendens]